jgi:hypothetical protein
MLANVTTVTGGLPSDVSVSGNGREVRITSQHAIKNGENYDVYKGEYLGQFPVSNYLCPQTLEPWRLTSCV